MRIIECYIENFGTLSEFKHSFSGGLNVFKQDNGYGKTTLTVFLKAMLYGLESTKKIKLEDNERKHYSPWNKGRFGGSLTFEIKGKIYRVERTFMNKSSEDEFKLYDCASGKESSDYTSNLGEEIFGIDSDGFERTLFLSEMNFSVKNDNKSISAKLSDLVGTGGDLGVMDEAVELLEKQRKTYYKKGGSGEIADIKSQISSIDLQLADIEHAKEKYENLGLKIAQVNKFLNTLFEDKKRIEKAISKGEEERIKRTFEKQYASMKQIFEDDIENLKPLQIFFNKGVPSEEEISLARESYIESSRISATDTGSSYGKEYEELSIFFQNDADESEYEAAKSALSKIDDKRAELRILERNAPEQPSKNHINVSESEIETLRKKLSGKCRKRNGGGKTLLKLVFAIIGICAAVLGVLINPIFYILCIAFIGLIPFKKKDAVNDADIKRAREILTLLGIEHDEKTKDLLSLLEKAKIVTAEHNLSYTSYTDFQKKLEDTKVEICNLEASLAKFISNFPVGLYDDMYSCVSNIFSKKQLFLVLKQQELQSNHDKQTKLAIAKIHAEKAKAFLSKYPTVSANPFDEISVKLFEYKTLIRTVEKAKNTLEQYAKEHNISALNDMTASDFSLQFTRADIEKIDLEITEEERKKAVFTRECLELYEQIENEEGLLLERAELKEKEALYTKKLFTIQKAKDFLNEAKDMLTAKYLSKTRAAFDKYIGLICQEPAESFIMDTSFGIMKNERGSYKPSEAYSKGTKDAYYLAARLALIDSLYENEKPFIILDDPFVNLDDGKFLSSARALKAIAKDKQIIYMTCSESRVI